MVANLLTPLPLLVVFGVALAWLRPENRKSKTLEVFYLSGIGGSTIAPLRLFLQ